MYRLGILRLDQFRKFQPGEAHSALNRIALNLLLDASGAERVRLYELAMPQIRLSSGIYRTTSRERFRDLDERVNGWLSQRFEASQALDVQDWAASDCVASAEWAAALWRHFPAAKVTASDLTLFLIEATLGDEKFICEASGEPLQYLRPPFVIRFSPPEHKLMLVNRFLAWRGRNQWRRAQADWKIPEEWLRAEGGGSYELPPFVLRKIPLLHPEAEALRKSSHGFETRMHSVFEPLERRCDVLRTMNVYNRAYFSEEKLKEGVRAVSSSLTPGGIWIVGRTVKEDPPVHDASLFTKDGDEFRLLETLGNGTEIAPLISKHTQ